MVFLLVLVSLMAITAILSGWMCYKDGQASGRREGEQHVYSRISTLIKTHSPFAITLNGPGGFTLEKLFDITERKDPSTTVKRSGGVAFGDKPDGGRVPISIYRDNAHVMTVYLPFDSLPKSLLGKKLDAELSFYGW